MDVFLPIVKKVTGNSIADDIIGVRPNETFESAINRHMLEKRFKKIKKINERIKNNSKQINIRIKQPNYRI